MKFGSMYEKRIDSIRRMNQEAKRVMFAFERGNIQYETISHLMAEISYRAYYNMCEGCPHYTTCYSGEVSCVSPEQKYLSLCIPRFIDWSDNEIEASRKP